MTAEQFKANNTHPDEKLRLGCGVCAVPADKAMTAGLRIVADRTETDPGHVLLPDINYPDFEGKDHTDESTVRIRIWIAKLIEAVELVIPPGTPPM